MKQFDLLEGQTGMNTLETDGEIERIRQKKMTELIQKRNEVAMRQELASEPVVLTDDTFETVKKYPFVLV